MLNKIKKSKSKSKSKKLTTADILASIGIEELADRIEDGESFASISKSLKMSTRSLMNWLHLDHNYPIYARARESSAEAWLDHGLRIIKSALPKDGGIDASAARAYAQECARRAGIRNERYRDKTQTEITGANGGAIQHEHSDLDAARRIAMALAIGMDKMV